ncbi:MAG TPA: hypothetical protein PKE49_14475 [Leptospiraceae bacterium]|nr:hypothetical protein [Leptospiraceae bacterium]HMX57727.1 hypothetical protein [Leptospiraceae bacterium]HNL01121.1 hypothetical protein [Leptospiraceae bacterium]
MKRMDPVFERTCDLIDGELENWLQAVLGDILTSYDRLHLRDPLCTCLLELATNANKANMKHIFFLEKGWDIYDPQLYTERLKEFRDHVLHFESTVAYAEKAKQAGLYVRVSIHHSPAGLKIAVYNNLPVIPEDEKRIREKFLHALEYQNLVDFYRDYGDNSEGSGLGFALMVLMLRSEGIPPSLLRVGTDGGQTAARIEVPFHPGSAPQSQ